MYIKQISVFMENRPGRLAEITKILSEKEVRIIADMHMGSEEARAWGCDLTYDYVKINADYRS